MIVSLIEQIARKNDITLSDIKPVDPVTKTSNYTAYAINVGLQGSFKQVINFIIGLRQADVLFDIKKANLKVVEGSLQLKISLLSYIFK